MSAVNSCEIRVDSDSFRSSEHLRETVTRILQFKCFHSVVGACKAIGSSLYIEIAGINIGASQAFHEFYEVLKELRALVNGHVFFKLNFEGSCHQW